MKVGIGEFMGTNVAEIIVTVRINSLVHMCVGKLIDYDLLGSGIG